MSAHVVFTAIDPERPATQSPAVIREIVRGEIGFDGLLMTDDLSMQALTGRSGHGPKPPSQRDLDIALHCNGERAEMEAVCEGTPLLAGDAARRAAADLARLGGAEEGLDIPEARARFAAALAEAA